VSTPRKLAPTPALDGIRGLAIILVMTVHIGWLSGGFVGVDLFFVLSGFLITTLLLQERDRCGALSLQQFYARRMRRLLPALLLTVPLGWIAAVVYPTSLTSRPYWFGVVGALAYVNNWLQLWDSSNLRTLAHTWSLAVEEQFYLLWPASVMLVLRRRKREISAIGSLVLVVIVVSAVATAVIARADPSANLYVSTLSRVGEILLGCGLSVLWRHRRLPRVLSGTPAIVAALTTLTVLCLYAQERAAWLYAWGGLYVAAAIGVVLVAVVLERPGSRATTVLASGPLAYTGRISYGMYLFNYPLSFLLAPEVLHVGSGVSGLLVVAATWGMAAASYQLLEQPILRGELGSPLKRALSRRSTPLSLEAVRG
jgi:peptidoglycan/LPS O-acetylase OafA/YrhL